MNDSQEKIRITWEDVESAEVAMPTSVARPTIPPVPAGGTSSWGSIASQQTSSNTVAEGRTIWLEGWFYLGFAGLVGAFLAWMFCEPTFQDFGPQGWGNVLLFPLVVIFMCVSLGIAESIVERSWHRLFLRGIASVGLGLVLGFIITAIANIVFGLLVSAFTAGLDSPDVIKNSLLWISRSLAWAIFGVAGGLVFGIMSKSAKKTYYGMLGGIIGAALGGLFFDPISLLARGAELSRAIGVIILGSCTGIAIGLVENALKDRWLYVSSGPLAGKQFVLYQDIVTIGKNQASTIYLFKDPSILEQHARIDHRLGKSLVTAFGPLMIAGQPLQTGMQHTLRSGDILQIGRYTFSYAEKEVKQRNE